jgi:hypothetical protein
MLARSFASVAVLVVLVVSFAIACSPFRNIGDAPDVNGNCPNPSVTLAAFYGTCRQTCRVDIDCAKGTVCTCGGSYAPFEGGGKHPTGGFGVCLSPCTEDSECTPMKRCRFATQAESQSTIPPHELKCVDAKPVCAKDGFCHATCANDGVDSFCNDGGSSVDTCSETTSGSICTTDQICSQP